MCQIRGPLKPLDGTGGARPASSHEALDLGAALRDLFQPGRAGILGLQRRVPAVVVEDRIELPALVTVIFGRASVLLAGSAAGCTAGPQVSASRRTSSRVSQPWVRCSLTSHSSRSPRGMCGSLSLLKQTQSWSGNSRSAAGLRPTPRTARCSRDRR